MRIFSKLGGRNETSNYYQQTIRQWWKNDSVNVFVFSDIKDRISYAVSHYGVDEKQAKLMIEKTDRERKMHAMSFYSKEWGNRNNYDLLLNSGKLGIEKCVELIVNAVK